MPELSVEETVQERLERYARRDWRVGDRVRFRAWEDMEQEYGADSDGDIARIWFMDSMRHLCGQEATIESFGQEMWDDRRLVYISLEGLEGRTDWDYNSDMFEAVETSEVGQVTSIQDDLTGPIEVGSYVRIKSWKRLKKEFIELSGGGLACIFYFNPKMKYLCGLEGEVIAMNGDEVIIDNPVIRRIPEDRIIREPWNISKDMVYKVRRIG